MFLKLNLLERASFWMTWEHSEQCDDRAERTFVRWFVMKFPGIVETIECLCKVRRRVLWRWSYSPKSGDDIFLTVSIFNCQTFSLTKSAVKISLCECQGVLKNGDTGAHSFRNPLIVAPVWVRIVQSKNWLATGWTTGVPFPAEEGCWYSPPRFDCF